MSLTALCAFLSQVSCEKAFFWLTKICMDFTDDYIHLLLFYGTPSAFLVKCIDYPVFPSSKKLECIFLGNWKICMETTMPP